MRYYEIQAELEEVEKHVEQEGDGEEVAVRFLRGLRHPEQADRILEKTESFNSRLDGKTSFFVSNLRSRKVMAGAVTTEDRLREKELAAFFREIGVPVLLSSAEIKETVFSELRGLLRDSCRNGYIDDDNSILSAFRLLYLTHRVNEFNEKLIETGKLPELYRKAEDFLSEETLVPELSRIAEPLKKKRIKGHPVHYLVETDSREVRKNLCSTLLSALFLSGRVRNQRYSYTDIDLQDGFSSDFLENLYHSAVGGSLIIRFEAGTEPGESSYASQMQEALETVSEQLTAFRNDVLTIICLPGSCENMKTILYENLAGTGLIEIKEDLADRRKAEKYLRFQAKKNGIRTDRALFSSLKDDRTYLSQELTEIFDVWYDEKLKSTYYPQYKGVGTARRKAAAEKKKGSAYGELSEMAGLSEAKDVINKAIDYYKAQKLFRDMGMKEDHPAMHMVFTGNPGSAKTTVARLFARIMKDNGLLSQGTLVEVGRGDLVGKYVGWTAPTVQKYFARAKGGVLFIDEAYSLVDDKDGLYGDEAINTIVQEMENHRDDVVVIFAGYPDKMETFLNKNPGLRSRIAFHVPFSDYSTEELCEIAKLLGKKKGVHFTEDAMARLADLFEEARNFPDFGNGRFVRNVLEKSRMNQASRLLQKNVDEITREDLSVIEAEDIEGPALSERKEARTIGFMY